MKLLQLIMSGPRLKPLERPMERLKEIRDSYRALNVAVYGEEIAGLLNHWEPVEAPRRLY